MQNFVRSTSRKHFRWKINDVIIALKIEVILYRWSMFTNFFDVSVIYSILFHCKCLIFCYFSMRENLQEKLRIAKLNWFQKLQLCILKQIFCDWLDFYATKIILQLGIQFFLYWSFMIEVFFSTIIPFVVCLISRQSTEFITITQMKIVSCIHNLS